MPAQEYTIGDTVDLYPMAGVPPDLAAHPDTLQGWTIKATDGRIDYESKKPVGDISGYTLTKLGVVMNVSKERIAGRFQ